jgi:hypothetical protein
MTGDLVAELLKTPDWNGARVLQDTRFVLGFFLKISKNILRGWGKASKTKVSDSAQVNSHKHQAKL